MTRDPHADIDAALSELLAPDTAHFRPSNWSDTHTAPPQVSDLADEAWEYALDHGCSMEQALKALQDRQREPEFIYRGVRMSRPDYVGHGGVDLTQHVAGLAPTVRKPVELRGATLTLAPDVAEFYPLGATVRMDGARWRVMEVARSSGAETLTVRLKELPDP